jgi:hypothetical protein
VRYHASVYFCNSAMLNFSDFLASRGSNFASFPTQIPPHNGLPKSMSVKAKPIRKSWRNRFINLFTLTPFDQT